jgi:hypothetical protein
VNPEDTVSPEMVKTQEEQHHHTAFREFVMKNRIDPGSFTTNSMFKYPLKRDREPTDVNDESFVAAGASTEVQVPARRCRGKTTVKQLIAENNLKVAHHAPQVASNRSQAIKQTTAIITQADMVSKSKYVQYHQLMGHTPSKIVAVNSSHKKRFLQTTNLPTDELKNKRIFMVVDESIQQKRLKAPQKRTKLAEPHVQCNTQQ